MSPIPNPTIIFAERPDGFPIPGQHVVFNKDGITIDLDNVELNGGVLAKTLSLSIDPTLRVRMRSLYEVGQPIHGYGLGTVLRSENSAYKPGDHIYAERYPFSEYAIVPKDIPKTSRSWSVTRDPELPWSYYVGVLGMPGKTAWIGFKALCRAKKGEIFYISTAAGAVGSLLCQIAKSEGLRVIGSAGSEEKVNFLKDLGVDVAFNYKTEDLDQVLKENGPIDIYWDAVGGRSLETALEHMNMFGRVIVCGFISQYNTTEAYGVKNLHLINTKFLTLSGFMVGPLTDQTGDFDFFPNVTKLVKEGKVKSREEARHGLEALPQFLLDVLKGNNTGKAVVIVSDE